MAFEHVTFHLNDIRTQFLLDTERTQPIQKTEEDTNNSCLIKQEPRSHRIKNSPGLRHEETEGSEVQRHS